VCFLVQVLPFIWGLPQVVLGGRFLFDLALWWHLSC
jgi:hypothetical protein